MLSMRTMFSLIIAAAIAHAPFAPIWTGQATAMIAATKIAATETDGHGHAAVHDAHPVGAVHESMDDCASMMGGAVAPDCPYCGKDMACSPEFCLAKCFQFVGLALELQVLARHETYGFRPVAYAHPPDWSDPPRPPPPRT